MCKGLIYRVRTKGGHLIRLVKEFFDAFTNVAVESRRLANHFQRACCCYYRDTGEKGGDT